MATAKKKKKKYFYTLNGHSLKKNKFEHEC